MGLHAACSVLLPGDPLLLYGAKDEGIESALREQELFEKAVTLGVGGRCRVLGAVRVLDPVGLKGTLTAWKSLFSPGFPGLPDEWVSYPGIFAHGHLDPGTRLLLGALPELAPGSRILDYGCGSGVVGYLALNRDQGTEVDLLDVDAVALAAAAENLPEGRVILGDGLPGETKDRYHAILSNPPFHVGKGEDPGLIVHLVEGAPRLLTRGGMLVAVAQRRLPLRPALQRNFGRIRVLAEDGTYRVWEAREPLAH
jgi:16S rRNA (guanine1207-N2)-methyltransferase